ncbi:hypothetical protein D3C72_2176580 [compost metagenome]
MQHGLPGRVEAELRGRQAGTARIGQHPFHGAEQVGGFESQREVQGGEGGGWHVLFSAGRSIR